MDKMRIEIWSDIACPYCYIGKRKLELALKQFEHSDKVELVWYSYELDPTLPKKPVEISIYEYIGKKYGIPVEESKQNHEKLVQSAKEVGLHYDFDKLIVTNTSDALRLVKLAAKQNLATEAEEILFKAYFEDGKCISDRQVLIDLGVSIGLQSNDIAKMLDSDQFVEKLRTDMERAEEKFNLQYIPFYRFNFNQVIQGAIAVDDYLQVLKDSYKDWTDGTSGSGSDIKGQSCSIDGVCS